MTNHSLQLVLASAQTALQTFAIEDARLGRCGAFVAPAQHLVHDLKQFFFPYRLRNKAVHSGRQTHLGIAFATVSRHGYNGKVSQAASFLLAQGASGKVAIENGHVDVHEDEVERALFDQFQNGFTARGQGYLVSLLFQGQNGHGLTDRIVVGHQHSESRTGQPGRVAPAPVARRLATRLWRAKPGQSLLGRGEDAFQVGSLGGIELGV